VQTRAAFGLLLELSPDKQRRHLAAIDTLSAALLDKIREVGAAMASFPPNASPADKASAMASPEVRN